MPRSATGPALAVPVAAGVAVGVGGVCGAAGAAGPGGGAAEQVVDQAGIICDHGGKRGVVHAPVPDLHVRRTHTPKG